MRTLTASAKRVVGEGLMRITWFHFYPKRNVRVFVDTVGTHGREPVEEATIELHLSLERKGHETIVESIDIKELAQQWAEQILEEQ